MNRPGGLRPARRVDGAGHARWFRHLLRLYPAAFRREFAAEMIEVFTAEQRQKAAKGRGSAVRFWTRTLLLTTWCALLEHAASARDRIAPDPLEARRARRRIRFERYRRQFVVDVRLALDEVERRPGRSVAIVGVAAGLVAFAVAGASVARAGLFGLGYPAADRLVSIETAFPNLQYESFPLTASEFRETSDAARSYERIGAWSMTGGNVTAGARLTRETIVWATPEVFTLLGLPIRPEPAEGAPPNAYATTEFWEARLFGDPGAIGRRFELDGYEVTLAGVLPRGFRFWGGEASLWVPAIFVPRPGGDTDHRLGVVGALRPGVSLAAARAEASRLTETWPARSGDVHGPGTGHQLQVRSLRATVVGPNGPPYRLLLVSAAGLLLLGLLHLAALGSAGSPAPDRLIARLLERSLLVVVGGTVGACLALLGLMAWTAAGLTPFDSGTAPSVRLLLVAGLSLVLLVTAVATLPARRWRPRWDVLVVLDVAASIGLLFGAGLIARSITNLSGADTGFRPSGLVAFEAALPAAGDHDADADGEADRAGIDGLMDYAMSLPSVTRVALTSSLPMSSALLPSDVFAYRASPRSESTPERGEEAPAAHSWAYTHFVSSGYTAALEVDLLEGRRIEGGAEAVVSRSLARELWPDGEAVGSTIRTALLDDSGLATVVGVVDDVAQTSLRDGGAAQLYVSRDLLPATGHLGNRFYMLLRTGSPREVARRVPQGLSVEGRSIPVSRPTRLDLAARSTLRRHSIVLQLLVIGAFLSLSLGLLTARARGAAAHAGAASLRRLVPAGLLGGLVLAATVRLALDPLLFDTGLLDPRVAAAVSLCLLAWLAAATRRRDHS